MTAAGEGQQTTGNKGLSAATEQRIEAEVSKYPKRRTGLLPALKLAQAETHLLTPPVIARVADLVGVSHAAANELATFYSMLHTEPRGTTTVEVCVQLPCALRGADELLERLSAHLNLQPGQTSANGAVTLLRTHECFGACHRAPMCLVNGEYRENLRGEQLEGFLAELRRLANEGGNPHPNPLPEGERIEAVPSPSGRGLG